jgi:hypothetical protein
MGPGAVGHVVIDRHGEGVGLLEHHADAAAQIGYIPAWGVYLLPPIGQGSSDFHPRNQVVHPVNGPQKGGLSAAGGADQGGDLPFRQVDHNIFQGMVLAIIQI